MSMWYKRKEAQRRFSFFLCGATLAGAFGGLLATGIGHMDGIRGYHAWRWIFIIEGLATCMLSVLAYFIVSDFPEDAKWLSEVERAFAIRRIVEDQGESNLERKVDLRSILHNFTNPKTLVAGFIMFGPSMSGASRYYSQSYLMLLNCRQVSGILSQVLFLDKATLRSNRNYALFHPGPPRSHSP